MPRKPRPVSGLTLRSVQMRVHQIRKNQGDVETAHGMEDYLWQEVLQTIADGTAEDPAALARAALKTTELDFDRWYA